MEALLGHRLRWAAPPRRVAVRRATAGRALPPLLRARTDIGRWWAQRWLETDPQLTAHAAHRSTVTPVVIFEPS